MADDFKESFSPDTAMLNAIIDEVHRGEAGQNTLDLDENSQDASEDDADNSSSSEDAEVDELKINLPRADSGGRKRRPRQNGSCRSSLARPHWLQLRRRYGSL